MLRVAILGNYSPTNGTGSMKGGAQSACSYLVDALRKYGDLDIHVITMDATYNEPTVDTFGDVTVHRIPLAGRAELLLGYRTLRNQIKRRLDLIEPDIIHAQDLTMGTLACSIAPDITILTVHGIVREEARYYESRRERWRSLLRARWIERTCLRNIKHVIVISPYVRRYYEMFENRNAYDIPNAIDEAFFDISSPGDAGRILYAGRVIPRKRVDVLIHVIDRVRRTHPNVCLRIAGDLSNRRYVRSLHTLVRERNLSAHVEFLGQQDEESVLEEFRRCQLLVLPSAQETAPMVIAQAMAAGKPVVSTGVGGVPEMIDNGETGFVVPSGDIEMFAARVEEVLNSKDERDRLGENARVRAEQEYRAGAVAAKTRNAYYEIATAVERSRTTTHLATK